ncbi:MAG: HdeD family acid-resistance protein [bacterium]
MASYSRLADFAGIRSKWGWFLVLGILMVILGTVALGSNFLFTIASIIFFGYLLLASGILQIFGAFWSRGWGVFFLYLLIGILNLIVGWLLLTRPEAGAITVTLVMAIFFIVGGLYRAIAAAGMQFPNWGWACFGGLVTLALGILLWRGWPATGLWFIGLYVGIDLIFHGWSWIMFALTARKLDAAAA